MMTLPTLQKKVLEDYDLQTLPPFDEIAYGPVKSRRLGESLGIDLLGPAKKICNFNCPYCELGLTDIKVSQIKKLMTFPTLEQIEESLNRKITSLSRNKNQPAYITFSGNGEPTLHPDFAAAVALVKKVRDRLLPKTKITVLTNGSTLGDSHIIKALNECDARMVKMDAGNDEVLMKIDSPLTRTNLTKLIQGTKALSDVILQTMFIRGIADNTSPDHIDDWIEVVGLIRPAAVHLYSIDKLPAVAGIIPVPKQRLKEIANLLEKRIKISALIFS